MRHLKFPELNYFQKLLEMLGQNARMEISYPMHDSKLALELTGPIVITPFGKGKRFELSGYMDIDGYEAGIYVFRFIVVDRRTPKKNQMKHLYVFPSHAEEPDFHICESIDARHDSFTSVFISLHQEQENQTALAIVFMGYIQRFLLSSLNPQSVRLIP